MDEAPEEDAETLTLVNARKEAGTLSEAAEHTGVWAQKDAHGNNAMSLTRLTGKVIFEHVDFGYSPKKKRYKQEDLLRSIEIVMQEVNLFTGAIMVLDHGEVIERGMHESLVTEKGTILSTLYTRAFEFD